jgi:hypothetical protein
MISSSDWLGGVEFSICNLTGALKYQPAISRDFGGMPSGNIFDLLGSVLSQIQAPQGSGDPSKSLHHSIEPNRAGKMRIFFLLIDVATKEGFTGGVK